MKELNEKTKKYSNGSFFLSSLKKYTLLEQANKNP